MIGMKQTRIGDLVVSTTNMTETLACVDEMVRGGGPHYLCFCDSTLLVNSRHNRPLARALNSASMTLPDGIVLVMLSRLLGRPIFERVAGPSFMLAACEYGLDKGYRHFFFGGAEGVADELAGRLQEKFPGLIVAGTYTPPFRPMTAAEKKEARGVVREARPDLMWIGLSSAQMVLWMEENYRYFGAPVMLGVGAAFDFHSGRVPWAPRWVRRIGMEWAYRTMTGGNRIFTRNLRTLPRACLFLITEVWRARFRESLSR